MSPLQAAFVDWIRQRCEAAEHLLTYELSEGPRGYFLKNSSGGANEFYAAVDLWRRWLSALLTGLRHRAEHADHLVVDAERRFAVDKLLTVRLATHDGQAKTFDLSDQSRYTLGDGWLEVRGWFERGREDPLWRAVTDTLVRELRSFSIMVAEQAKELRLRDVVSEPTPTMSAAGQPRYECLASLGAGAYGEAWRARDTELNRDVVVKFIRTTGAGRKEAVEAARALARVTDPNIVVVHDVADVPDPVTAKVLDAVIMELLEGPSLLERIGNAMSRDEALRIGAAILNAVAAYHANGLVHLDFHEGNVIVGDRVVKVIDPMYFETIAVQSHGTRAELQQRELRRARDTLAAMLRVTDIDMNLVIDFERTSFRADLATLRATFEEVLLSTRSSAIATAAPSSPLDQIPDGFEPGPLADIGRSLISQLVAMGEGERRGYSGLLDVTSFANERQLPLQQVYDAADLLTDQGFVTRERMNRMLMLTLAGREEAHRLGETIASPNADYGELLRFLANYGEGDARGATTVDETVLGPALGFSRFRLLDAGELLRLNQTGDMLVTMGGPIRVSLSARGRQSATRVR